MDTESARYTKTTDPGVILRADISEREGLEFIDRMEELPRHLRLKIYLNWEGTRKKNRMKQVKNIRATRDKNRRRGELERIKRVLTDEREERRAKRLKPINVTTETNVSSSKQFEYSAFYRNFDRKVEHLNCFDDDYFLNKREEPEKPEEHTLP